MEVVVKFSYSELIHTKKKLLRFIPWTSKTRKEYIFSKKVELPEIALQKDSYISLIPYAFPRKVKFLMHNEDGSSELFVGDIKAIYTQERLKKINNVNIQMLEDAGWTKKNRW